MTALLGLLASPLGRAGLVAMLGLAGLGGIYLKGRSDGRAACLAEGERDVEDTIRRAEAARAAADRRNADERRLRDDDAFRRD